MFCFLNKISSLNQIQLLIIKIYVILQKCLNKEKIICFIFHHKSLV